MVLSRVTVNELIIFSLSFYIIQFYAPSIEPRLIDEHVYWLEHENIDFPSLMRCDFYKVRKFGRWLITI